MTCKYQSFTVLWPYFYSPKTHTRFFYTYSKSTKLSHSNGLQSTLYCLRKFHPIRHPTIFILFLMFFSLKNFLNKIHPSRPCNTRYTKVWVTLKIQPWCRYYSISHSILHARAYFSQMQSSYPSKIKWKIVAFSRFFLKSLFENPLKLILSNLENSIFVLSVLMSF